MKRFWIDFAVGIFVLLGLLAVIFIAFRVGNVSVGGSEGTYSIRAEFDNIGGVRVGAPVKSSGIAVGVVRAINLNTNKYKAVMELEVKEGFKFPTDSQVAIFTTGLLGEQYVALNPGIEEDMLADGDTAEYTQSAVIIEKLIGQAMLSLTNKKE